jgi:hypothetical protein
MKMMDDSDDEGGVKWDKPEGTKKAKERMKIESDSSLLREKFDQMMHTKEAMTMKTLEAKLAITEKKKEVKLAKVEACLKPFFMGQGVCRGDHRPYLQMVKQNILFYGL